MAKQKGKQGNPPPDDDDDEDGGGGTLSDSMRTEITNLVNAAVSGQLSRKLPNAITAAVEGAIAPLRESLANGGARRRSDDDDEDAGDDDDEDAPPQRGKNKGKNAGAARAKDPEFDRMQKRLNQLETERKQEREQARNRERDTLLREQLEAAGVDKNRIRGAVAVLRDSMKYDDKTGEWSYKAKRDGFDEDVDIAAGVGEWASTDEGKSYLAPPNSGGQPRGGSGMRPNGGAGGTGAGAPRLANGGRPAQDPKAAKQAAKQDAMKALAGAVNELGGGTVNLG